MTGDQKENAVLVAKDVLAQLARTDIPLHISNIGHYFFLHDVKRLGGLPEDLQNYVDKIQELCVVCARGALVLSKARLLNDVSMSLLIHKNDIHLSQHDTSYLLQEVWDDRQLELIEAAFETTTSLSNGYADSPNITRAVYFGRLHGEPAVRLAAIMQNIIENQGDFVP